MKHKHKKAMGGKAEKSKMNEYNAKGSPAMAAAKDEKDGFKKGGHVHGSKSSHRLDKRARGGRMGESSPFSAAHKGEMPGKQSSGTGSGHEDEQPSDMD